MEFAIACETVKRLARITDNENRFIRLEHIPESTVAIVTNRKLAVIERIGLNPTNQIGVMHFPLNDGIIDQCGKEAPFNSSVNISVNEILQYAVAKTTLGYPFQGNAMQPMTIAAINEWRSWVPPKPITKTNGAMFWNTDLMSQLVSASPSGRVVFPEFIDVNKPIILRDYIDEKWLGLFMGNRITDAGIVEPTLPATLPKWLVL